MSRWLKLVSKQAYKFDAWNDVSKNSTTLCKEEKINDNVEFVMYVVGLQLKIL